MSVMVGDSVLGVAVADHVGALLHVVQPGDTYWATGIPKWTALVFVPMSVCGEDAMSVRECGAACGEDGRVFAIHSPPEADGHSHVDRQLR